jgi:hypothetical protein
MHQDNASLESTLTDSAAIRSILVSVLAWCHDRTAEDVKALVERVRASKKVLACLSSDDRKVIAGVLELWLVEANSLSSESVFCVHDLPALTGYDDRVQRLVARIRSVEELPHDAHATWQALVERVQRGLTVAGCNELVELIAANATTEEVMAHWRTLEAPTSRKAEVRKASTGLTAAEFLAAHQAATAGRQAMRYSCGMRTLDQAYTVKGDPLGFIAPGQFYVVMGPTGTGKSSFSYGITPALSRDLRNWGLEDALQIFFHTEEETVDKLQGFGVYPGMANFDLADNLAVHAIGTSRKRMTEIIFDTVIAADERSRRTGRPITDFLPYVVQLDYIGSIIEQGENEVIATTNTAEFLLRGVAAWNPDELAKFGGVDFREYAGMSWPTGMEHHRVAVVGYAQLVKLNDEELTFRPGACTCANDAPTKCVKGSPRVCAPANRRVSRSDYVLLDDQGGEMWDLHEGDLRLFTKNHMRGSGVIANNAHAILILHRSQPYNNPVRYADGKTFLSDTRARILFEKARTPVSLQVAPMAFNSQPSGFRAQYYDALAEHAIENGVLTNYDKRYYRQSGDVILPIRPAATPLSQIKY